MASPVTEASAEPRSDVNANRYLPMMVAFAVVLVAAFAYVSYTGLIVFMGDSFLLANRAKHLVDHWDLNLDNGLAPLIYPPLYPILMAAAYLVHDPQANFHLILLINVLLAASQVIPVCLLLEQYCNLSRTVAACLAAALALSPASLPYTSMMMTEVLYFPVLAWLAFFVSRALNSSRTSGFIGAGAALALAMLTRSAASVVLVSYGIVLLAYLWMHRNKDWRAAFRCAALSACVFAVLDGGWLLFERFFVKYQGFMPQFELANVLGILQSARRFDLHFSWFTNCIFYFMLAPLSLASVFTFTLFARKPGLLRRDLTAVFFLSSMLMSAVVTSLVTEDHWGGRELTWNRYVMPYLIFALILAIRYRAGFNRDFLFLGTIVMALAALAFRPSYLGCHFTDALALFEKRRFPFPEASVNFAYFASVITAAWFWVRGSRASRGVALALTALVWAASDVASARTYHRGGDLNVTAYHGLAERAFRDSRAYPGSSVYYDPDFTRTDLFSGLRVLFFWPDLTIRPLPRDEFARLAVPARAHVLYFTTAILGVAPPLGEERGSVKLYELTGEQLSRAHSQPGASTLDMDMLGDFPAPEVGEKDHKSYFVRWLPQETDFTGNVYGPSTGAILSVELATNGPPRSARLIVNGRPAGEAVSVKGNFWSTPSTVARFHVFLDHGQNSFRLVSVEPSGKLPDGRPVSFLMIGEVKVSRAPAE